MDSLSVTLAVIALLIGAVADLLYRVAQQRGIEAPNFIFWQSTVFTAIIWTVAVVSWFAFGFDGPVGPVRGVAWLYGLPAGVCGYLGLTLFVASLRTGDASVNAPIFRLNFVITALGAMILLGESANLLKIGGILLAILAVLVLLNITQITAIRSDMRSILFALAASGFFGVAGLVAKAGLDTGEIGAVPIVLTQTVGFQQAAIITLMRRRNFSITRTVFNFAPGIAVLQVTWAVLLFESLRIGDASISYPIVQMSFVITAILAVVFLREEMNWSKGGGLVLAIIAVVALGLAG
ncbi:MAG: EamA family transporter [Dehalococcoidia bacterium]|nr:EamA family transporter [Dehalococcoidia bacterium]